MQINTNKKSGFTVIELLVYTAGMLVLVGAIITLIVFMYNLYAETTIGPRVDRVGISIVDRVTKDIRTGTSFNIDESQFGVATGALSLNTLEGTSEIKKYFALQNGRLVYSENDGAIQYLSPDDLSVSSFNLTSISTPISHAVHFNVTIDYSLKSENFSKSYSGVAILRHSYE